MTIQTKYDGVAQTLHWVMAAGMIFLLCLGLYMSDLEPAPAKFQLYGLHKALGMTMLILIVARILWRTTHTPPELLSTHSKWEHILAKFMDRHWGHCASFLGCDETCGHRPRRHACPHGPRPETPGRARIIPQWGVAIRPFPMI